MAIWPPATQRADRGSGLYRELQYPLDATTRRVELLAAGLRLRLAIAALVPEEAGGLGPRSVFTSEDDEERAL